MAILIYEDLLFLPYYQVVIVPYSLLLIIFLFVHAKRIIMPARMILLVSYLFVFMTISVIFGWFMPASAHYIDENTKRLLQFMTSFLYFTYFYNIALDCNVERTIKTIAMIFSIYFFGLEFLFNIFPESMNNLLHDVYGRLVIPKDLALEHLRFSYLFSDPNTAAYFFLIATLPWLTNYATRSTKICLLVFYLIVIILTGCRGALLALFFALLCKYFSHLKNIKSTLDTKKIVVMVALLAIVAILHALLDIFQIPSLSQYNTYGNISRLFDASGYASGGSRFDIWYEFISNHAIFPIGLGYQFENFSGVDFKPHSDIIRFLYSYGWVAAIIFLVIFKRMAFHFPLLFIPAFFALATNTLIDEQKLFALFLANSGVLLGARLRCKTKNVGYAKLA